MSHSREHPSRVRDARSPESMRAAGPMPVIPPHHGAVSWNWLITDATSETPGRLQSALHQIDEHLLLPGIPDRLGVSKRLRITSRSDARAPAYQPGRRATSPVTDLTFWLLHELRVLRSAPDGASAGWRGRIA